MCQWATVLQPAIYLPAPSSLDIGLQTNQPMSGNGHNVGYKPMPALSSMWEKQLQDDGLLSLLHAHCLYPSRSLYWYCWSKGGVLMSAGLLSQPTQRDTQARQ